MAEGMREEMTEMESSFRLEKEACRFRGQGATYEVFI